MEEEAGKEIRYYIVLSEVTQSIIILFSFSYIVIMLHVVLGTISVHFLYVKLNFIFDLEQV